MSDFRCLATRVRAWCKLKVWGNSPLHPADSPMFLASNRLSFAMPFPHRPLLGKHCLGLFTLYAVLSGNVFGQTPAEVDFATEIQPLLARRCYACHGPEKQEGSLRFDDRSIAVSPTDSGLPAIVEGKSHDSELIRRLRASEESGERMPPEGPQLSEREIARLSQWIDAGAEFTQHWAFRPPQTPELPVTVDRVWGRQPLDQFILAKLEQAGVPPAAEADPAALIRRVYLDVTGLPPTPEAVRELSSHWSEETYVQLIDRLLATPAFGEKWARMWLDVVRYAETNSFERDGAKPNAWKYRDYVIEAMNGDKPYSQFMREQIAGDELDEVTPASLTATGYYRLGLWDDEPADPVQARFDGYDDLVTTTSQGLLGLTLNCARCHDHKIDPLTQHDYYALVAFMRDVTPYAARNDLTSNNQLDLDPGVGAQHAALENRRRELEKQTRRIEQQAIKKMTAVDQRATEGPEREQVLQKKLQQYASPEDYLSYQQFKAELQDIIQAQRRLPARNTVLGLAKLDPRPEPTHILLRGSPQNEGELVNPAFPQLLGGGAPDIPSPAPQATSAGRRRFLADWLAADGNWMTSRVIVNRVWLHYFGRGIVGSPNNFGLMGEPPTHPQLLDFLATELVRDGWQLKQLHRSILLSSTYRLSTVDTPQAIAQDPDNRLLGRQNLRRLSAEQVRDAVLAIVGQLNHQVHGPSMYVSLSDEVLASQSRPGQGWGQSSAADQARRSIYIHVKRSLPVPLLSAFDFPDTDISCEARFLTTQPGQALTMLNSQWMQAQAQALLRRVEQEVGGEVELQAARCLELATSRPAQPADVAELVALVERLRKTHHLDEQSARQSMCLVALNINAFFYID
jgi:cytochrome c553